MKATIIRDFLENTNPQVSLFLSMKSQIKIDKGSANTNKCGLYVEFIKKFGSYRLSLEFKAIFRQAQRQIAEIERVFTTLKKLDFVKFLMRLMSNFAVNHSGMPQIER
jgi:hypothetical protein